MHSNLAAISKDMEVSMKHNIKLIPALVACLFASAGSAFAAPDTASVRTKAENIVDRYKLLPMARKEAEQTALETIKDDYRKYVFFFENEYNRLVLKDTGYADRNRDSQNAVIGSKDFGFLDRNIVNALKNKEIGSPAFRSVLNDKQKEVWDSQQAYKEKLERAGYETDYPFGAFIGARGLFGQYIPYTLTIEDKPIDFDISIANPKVAIDYDLTYKAEYTESSPPVESWKNGEYFWNTIILGKSGYLQAHRKQDAEDILKQYKEAYMNNIQSVLNDGERITGLYGAEKKEAAAELARLLNTHGLPVGLSFTSNQKELQSLTGEFKIPKHASLSFSDGSKTELNDGTLEMLGYIYRIFPTSDPVDSEKYQVFDQALRDAKDQVKDKITRNDFKYISALFELAESLSNNLNNGNDPDKNKQLSEIRKRFQAINDRNHPDYWAVPTGGRKLTPFLDGNTDTFIGKLSIYQPWYYPGELPNLSKLSGKKPSIFKNTGYIYTDALLAPMRIRALDKDLGRLDDIKKMIESSNDFGENGHLDYRWTEAFSGENKQARLSLPYKFSKNKNGAITGFHLNLNSEETHTDDFGGFNAGRSNTLKKDADFAYIFGSSSSIGGKNNVVLGYGSTSDDSPEQGFGSVSSGAEGKERTWTNVAAGRISAMSTDAVNGSQLYALYSLADEKAGITDKLATIKKKPAMLLSGENITISPDGIISTNETLTGNSLAYESGRLGNLTADNVSVSANESKFTDIQDGAISADSTDAVNGSQLYRLKNTALSNIRLDNMDIEAERFYGDLDNTRRKVAKQTALAASQSAIPQAVDSGTTFFGLGLGYYDGANAFAIGGSSFSDNGKHILKYSATSTFGKDRETGISVGYSYRF